MYLLEGVLLQLPQLLKLHQARMKALTTRLSSSPNPRRRHHATTPQCHNSPIIINNEVVDGKIVPSED